jgi:hypothetical protein
MRFSRSAWPRQNGGRCQQHHPDDRAVDWIGFGYETDSEPFQKTSDKPEKNNIRNFPPQGWRAGRFCGIRFVRSIDEVTMLLNGPGRLESPRFVKGIEEA